MAAIGGTAMPTRRIGSARRGIQTSSRVGSTRNRLSCGSRVGRRQERALRVLVFDGCERGAGPIGCRLTPRFVQGGRAGPGSATPAGHAEAEGRRRSPEADCAWPQVGRVGDCDPVGSQVDELKTCVAQKVSGSSDQQTACIEAGVHGLSRRFRRGPRRGFPMGARRRKRTSRLRPQKRPANAGLLGSG
jgi:hypothetical protein